MQQSRHCRRLPHREGRVAQQINTRFGDIIDEFAVCKSRPHPDRPAQVLISGDLSVSPTPARIPRSTPRRRHAVANQPPERHRRSESGPARLKSNTFHCETGVIPHVSAPRTGNHVYRRQKALRIPVPIGIRSCPPFAMGLLSPCVPVSELVLPFRIARSTTSSACWDVEFQNGRMHEWHSHSM